MSTRSSNIQRKCRPTLLPRKSAQQKRNRRKLGLMKKASEYSELCDAEVCVGIRFRESGRVFTFVSDPNGFWSKLDSLLVSYMRAGSRLYTLTMMQGGILPTAGSRNREDLQIKVEDSRLQRSCPSGSSQVYHFGG
jgi:hypothetical protein